MTQLLPLLPMASAPLYVGPLFRRHRYRRRRAESAPNIVHKVVGSTPYNGTASIQRLRQCSLPVVICGANLRQFGPSLLTTKLKHRVGATQAPSTCYTATGKHHPSTIRESTDSQNVISRRLERPTSITWSVSLTFLTFFSGLLQVLFYDFNMC